MRRLVPKIAEMVEPRLKGRGYIITWSEGNAVVKIPEYQKDDIAHVHFKFRDDEIVSIVTAYGNSCGNISFDMACKVHSYILKFTCKEPKPEITKYDN